MKIVIDTNIMVSAVFFGGNPQKILEALFERKFEAYISPAIAWEYQETFKTLQKKYPEKRVLIPLTLITGACTMIFPTHTSDVCRDPEDNKFIDCAYDAKCIYIVSGDKDLLSLKSAEGIDIITASEFVQMYLE